MLAVFESTFLQNFNSLLSIGDVRGADMAKCGCLCVAFAAAPMAAGAGSSSGKGATVNDDVEGEFFTLSGK